LLKTQSSSNTFSNESACAWMMPSVTSSEAGSGGTGFLFPVLKIAFFLAALPLVVLG